MTGDPIGTYVRVTRTRPCAVCRHDHWCRYEAGGRLALCNRVPSQRPAKGEGGGWLHVVDCGDAIGGVGNHAGPAALDIAGVAPKLSTAELTLIDCQCRTALPPWRLAAMARHLTISQHALQRLGVGWHADWTAYTFPMRDADGNIVGLRTRHADGSKRCLTGSRLGIVMHGGSWDTPPDVLIVTEGESDAAAAIDLGLTAIARPGCEACADTVIAYVARLRPGRVVLIADADLPGQRGAAALARRLAAGGTACRVLTLPDGAKDLRAWKLLPESNCHALAALIDAPADRIEDCHGPNKT